MEKTVPEISKKEPDTNRVTLNLGSAAPVANELMGLLGMNRTDAIKMSLKLALLVVKALKSGKKVQFADRSGKVETITFLIP
jgi:hypothetical protein